MSRACFRAVQSFLASVDTVYSYHIEERESKQDDGARRFVVVFSKPRPTRPVPDAVVRLYFRVWDADGTADGRGPRLEYKVESEDQIYRPEDHVPFADAWLDRVIERKLKLGSELDLGDEFTATRLTSEWDERWVGGRGGREVGASAEGKSSEELGADALELEQHLIQLFQAADARGTGSLSHADFVRLLRAANLGLTDDQILLLMSQVDENADSTVQFREFVRVGAELIQALRARELAEAEARMLEQEAEAEALRALASAEVEESVGGLYKRLGELDTEGCGVLPRATVRDALLDRRSTLTRLEANMVLSALPVDEGGLLVYADLHRAFVDVRLAVLRNSYMHARRSKLETYLLDLFRARDADDVGALPHRELIDAMCAAPELFLSRLQALSLVRLPDGGGDALVDYRTFAQQASMALERLFSPEAVKQRATLVQRAEIQPIELLGGRDRRALEEEMMELFRGADADGNGVLDRDEFRACLRALPLDLDDEDVATLMVAADANADGTIDYREFVSLAYNVLLHLARERALQQRMRDSPSDSAYAREEHAAAARIQALQRGKRARQEFTAQREAASKIQATHRGVAQRREYHAQREAATKIQAVHRGRIARQEAHSGK